MKRLLSIIAALIIGHNVWAQVDMPSPANILAWYPFCTDTFDHSGIGFDLFGGGTLDTTDRYNARNMAKYFNGTTAVMHYSTFFAMTGPFSYACWIYPIAVGAQKSVILYNGNPLFDGMGIMMDDGAGGPGTKISIFAGGGGLGDEVSTLAPVSLFAWHHIVLVRSGNAYLLYVDNTYVGAYIPVTTPTFPGFNTPTGVFQLGGDYTNNTSHFSGKIDDVAIYNKLLVYPPEIHQEHDFNPDIVFSLGNDTTICLDSIPLPVNSSIVSAYPYPTYYYSWDTLIGSAFSYYDTASLAHPFKYIHPGSDTVTYRLTITRPVVVSPTVTLPFGYSCKTVDTVRIKHHSVVVNLGNDTTFCIGGFITLNKDMVPVPGENFVWNTGDITDTLHVTTSNKYYVSIDSNFTTPLGTPATCWGSDTINVFVPTDSTRVHLLGDTALCQGGMVNLFSHDSTVNDTAKYGTAAHFIWGGPPNVGGSTTPIVTATTTGTYWLQVSDSGCVAADTIKATIVFDTLHVYNNDTALCIGSHIVTSASFDPTISYQWTPSAGIPSSSNPATTITPDTSAWYVLTGTIEVLAGTIAQCVAKDSFFIDVQPFPHVYAGGNRSVCRHDTIRIQPLVTPGWYTHYTYDWSPGTNLDDSTSSTVIFTPGDTTKLVLFVTTPAGCSGIDSAMIFTHAGDFAALVPVPVMCPGDSVRLFPTSSETVPVTYVWHPGTYLDDSTSSTPVIRPIVSTQYIGVATSLYGCKDTVSLDVRVHPAAIISFGTNVTQGDSVIIYPGESYQVQTSSNCDFFLWTPAGGLNDTTLSNPVATPAVSTKYIVTARTEDGCVTKDSISIKMAENSILAVPNAFIPGSGGINGTLKVILRGIARLRYFRIYNRWGNMVFESTDVNKGWDGTFNGKPEPLGVYVYDVQAVSNTGQVQQKQGNITLLR